MCGAMTGRAPPPPLVSDEVTKFVSVLKRQWLLYDVFEDLPPTCWPFIIPKTSEKVFLILSCAKQTLWTVVPPCNFRYGHGRR